jgi:hypothetical protein
VSRFVLDLEGGKKGLLINSHNLCGGTQKALVKMAGQNGMQQRRKTKLRVACGSSTSRHRSHVRRAMRVVR